MNAFCEMFLAKSAKYGRKIQNLLGRFCGNRGNMFCENAIALKLKLHRCRLEFWSCKKTILLAARRPAAAAATAF